MGTAVVPERTIYPGEELSADLVREVDVTNPEPAGGYADHHQRGAWQGNDPHACLPGRTIPAGAARCLGGRAWNNRWPCVLQATA
jgi:flagella basal body P-ring formation protein FlgA